MSSSADHIAGTPAQPDPSGDPDGTAVPAHIAHALWIVRTLHTYGRHLIATLESRAAVRSFAIIAYCFGTARVPAILSRLHRGVLRAAVLERVLLARAARGRDLVLLKPYEYTPRPKPARQQGAAAQAAATEAPPLPRRPAEQFTDVVHLPSQQQLEAVAQRQTTGRAMVDICLDLGVRPAVCSKQLWDEMFAAFMWYRGNVPMLMKQMHRRALAYRTEAERSPALSLPDTSFEGVRRALGFLAGETPVNPYADMASAVARAATAAFVPMAAAPARPP